MIINVITLGYNYRLPSDTPRPGVLSASGCRGPLPRGTCTLLPVWDSIKLLFSPQLLQLGGRACLLQALGTREETTLEKGTAGMEGPSFAHPPRRRGAATSFAPLTWVPG